MNGERRDVYKHPVTDMGKQSKRGRLKLVLSGAGSASAYRTVRQEEPGEDQLRAVFENGELVGRTTFAEVRERARLGVASG